MYKHIRAILQNVRLQEMISLKNTNMHQRSPGHEQKTFPGNRPTSWHRCGECDELITSLGRENVSVGVRVTGRRRATSWSCERSASDAGSSSVSPCCVRTALRHSSSPTVADCHQHTTHNNFNTILWVYTYSIQ